MSCASVPLFSVNCKLVVKSAAHHDSLSEHTSVYCTSNTRVIAITIHELSLPEHRDVLHTSVLLMIQSSAEKINETSLVLFSSIFLVSLHSSCCFTGNSSKWNYMSLSRFIQRNVRELLLSTCFRRVSSVRSWGRRRCLLCLWSCCRVSCPPSTWPQSDVITLVLAF